MPHGFDVSWNCHAPFDLIYIDDKTDMRVPCGKLQNENAFYGFQIFWNTSRNQQVLIGTLCTYFSVIQLPGVKVLDCYLCLEMKMSHWVLGGLLPMNSEYMRVKVLLIKLLHDD